MNYITFPNFISNIEDIISNTIVNKEIMTIKTKDGGAVLMSEQQYMDLIGLIRKQYKDIESL